jgi:hypothetical protein
MKRSSILILLVGVFALALLLPGRAAAAPPPNDDFANAAVISSLPLSDTVDVTDATNELGEPAAFGVATKTVWYAFTPTSNVEVIADLSGSDGQSPFLSIWASYVPGLAALMNVGNAVGPGASIDVQLLAGTTYYIQAGDAWDPGAVTTISLRVSRVMGPSNDDFADATVVSNLPFSDSVNTDKATIEQGEPIADPNYLGRTVWYSFTPPADAVVTTARPITPPDPGQFPSLCELRSSHFLVIYQADGPGFAGLTPIAGSQWSNDTANTLHVHAGTTYYFQGGQNGGLNETGCPPFSLNLTGIAPPLNDNFADAIAFNSVPYSDGRDITAASVEPGEPNACGANLTQSIWYSFTPTESSSYGKYGLANIAVYTGSSLGDLRNVACGDWDGVYFHADAGVTYYMQLWGGGLSLDAVPPPNADFTFSPADPSVFDEATFSYWNGGYWDPTVNGWSWDFGDGATAIGANVSHRYANDGDYTVALTVAARGERSAVATKTVQVRTHDVAIRSFDVPDKGRVGKTKTVTIGIGNTHYKEMVRVDLYKIGTQGSSLVGTTTQTVKAMKPKVTKLFSFDYQFTSDDLAYGKIQFQAVATIQDARDALPTDNSLTSPAVIVKP